MKEEVSCNSKDSKGLLQKFQKSCYENIKYSKKFENILPALGT